MVEKVVYKKRLKMSAQIVEIIILAVIAFLIISKFLSVLGTTDEDDPAKSKAGSFFGEPTGLKDVTGTAGSFEAKPGESKVIPLRANVVFSTDSKINDIIRQIVEKMPDFNHEKFLKGAQAACKMIIDAVSKNDEQALSELVDKRFISEIGKKTDHYSQVPNDIKVAYEDAYSFGNSIYIKVAVTGKKLKEFWVFTRNLQQSGQDWYLSNIEI